MNERLVQVLERYNLEIPDGFELLFSDGFERFEVMLDSGYLTEVDVLVYLTSGYLTSNFLSDFDIEAFSAFHGKLAVIFNRLDWSYWDELRVRYGGARFDFVSYELEDILEARRDGVATKRQIVVFNELLDLKILSLLAANPVSTTGDLWELDGLKIFELRDKLAVYKRLAKMRKRGLVVSNSDSRLWLITEQGLDLLREKGLPFEFREPCDIELQLFNARPIHDLNTALVLRFLRDNPGLKVRQIADGVDVYEVSVTIPAWRRRMDKYIANGWVEKKFSQFWITDLGLSYLSTFDEEALDAFVFRQREREREGQETRK